MTSRLLGVSAALVATVAMAGTKVVKNDTFTGSGSTYAGISFQTYEGAGVLFTPDPADYPLKIIAIDVLVAPYGASSASGSYEFDLWDEDGGVITPPVFGPATGRINREGVGVTASTTMFNRYTFTNPVIVTGGKVFVKFSEQLETSFDNTTIALDNGPAVAGANWFFNGFGGFEPFNLPDGGYYRGLNRNWLIRLVLEVPDQAVTVTSITPNMSRTNVSTNVVITGTNFELGAKAFIGTTELTLNSLTSVTIGATVPVGLQPGTYDVRVRNTSGVQGVLTNGYTVFEVDGGAGTGGGGGSATGGGTATGGGSGTGGGAATGGGTATGGGSGTGGGSSTGNEPLALASVTPSQVYTGDPNSLFLTGGGFKAGALVLIGSTRVDTVTVESAGVISGDLSAGLLAPGTYDVSVINVSGEKATLEKALKVLGGTRVQPGCSCNSVELVPLVLTGLFLLRRRRH